jgi:hypothetical protein
MVVKLWFNSGFIVVDNSGLIVRWRWFSIGLIVVEYSG